MEPPPTPLSVLLQAAGGEQYMVYRDALKSDAIDDGETFLEFDTPTLKKDFGIKLGHVKKIKRAARQEIQSGPSKVPRLPPAQAAAVPSLATVPSSATKALFPRLSPTQAATVPSLTTTELLPLKQAPAVASVATETLPPPTRENALSSVATPTVASVATAALPPPTQDDQFIMEADLEKLVMSATTLASSVASTLVKHQKPKGLQEIDRKLDAEFEDILQQIAMESQKTLCVGTLEKYHEVKNFYETSLRGDWKEDAPDTIAKAFLTWCLRDARDLKASTKRAKLHAVKCLLHQENRRVSNECAKTMQDAIRLFRKLETRDQNGRQDVIDNLHELDTATYNFVVQTYPSSRALPKEASFPASSSSKKASTKFPCPHTDCDHGYKHKRRLTQHLRMVHSKELSTGTTGIATADNCSSSEAAKATAEATKSTKPVSRSSSKAAKRICYSDDDDDDSVHTAQRE